MPPTNDSFIEYNLQNLIEDYDYSFTETHYDADSLISMLELPAPQPDRVTVIGINGPTCAGKTTFSQILADRLAQRVPAVELSFEWFLYERSERARLVEAIAQGRKSIPGVTAAAWDVPRYSALLRKLKNLRSDYNLNSKLELNNLYNRVSGQTDAQLTLRVPYGGYVIVEGVSVLDIDDANLVDCYIRLDVDDDQSLMDRIIAREKIKPRAKQLSEDFLRHRFSVIDLHHMRYLRKISLDNNKYIINTSNFNQMKVFSNAKLS